uniref:1-phosphatidylinositol-4-phosphate 5-kinase n=1 Tax=Oryza brachyantha TaxID=4533 RepID=G2XMI0_ORYBR|nr:hypothetical_protein [Oryza brachyantha]
MATGKKTNQLPPPASRLWEAGIRKLKYSTILRGSVSSSTKSNTIYQYNDDDGDDTDSVLDDNDTDDDEEEVALGEPSHAEQLLPSGDFYQGDLRGELPHGAGKYLWTDGSMYEGSWRRGRASGRGKFSWPSGAIYEGDLDGGYMHGQGTYIGELGDTFAGLWANNLRHGRGTQAYDNGDVYDGHWRDGLQDGHGRYIWRGGHEYIGTWKAGEMHGRGTVIWADGDRYDGAWEDAKPKGQGTFRWSDGGMYIGLWCQECGETQARGVYYPPSGGPAVPVPREPKEEITKLLEELEMCEGKTASLLPSQKVVTWPGVDPVMKKPVWRPPEVGADQGRRHAVGRNSAPTSLDLKASAFDPKEKVWTRFPPEGSKNTPPHQSCDFRWKDYCPLVFRTLRKLFDVDPADYMISICGDDALLELSSPGKSGSFFYFTNDDKYMIKTMKKSEVKVLLRMLPAYYKHVRSFDNTLVTKFFGLHCVKITGAIQKKVRFVIMGNLFCSNYAIHRRFDLKGSSHGRTTDKPIDQIDETTTLKDLDLNFIFRLEGAWQVDKDCELLEQERIMDYSLLVGIHFKDQCKDIKAPVKLGISMPSRVESVVKNPDSESLFIGDPTGEFREVILFFGIIDILQDYDISKKLEHAYKSMQYDPNSISAVDPKQYCKRFRDFIYRAFTEDVQ